MIFCLFFLLISISHGRDLRQDSLLLDSSFANLRAETKSQSADVHALANGGWEVGERSCPTENAIKAFGKPAHCPGTSWIDSLVRADGKRNKIAFDVGCNKGDDAIRWLKRYGNRDVWGIGAWAKSIDAKTQIKPGKKQYACRKPSQNEDNSTVTSQDVSSESDFPVVVCIEAMPNNFKMLTTAAKELGYFSTSRSDGQLHILHGFVGSGEKSSVDFPDGPLGSEALHPDITNRKNMSVNASQNMSVNASQDMSVNASQNMSVSISQRDSTNSTAFVNLSSALPRNETRPYKLIQGTPVPVLTVDGIVHELKLPRVDILTVDTEGADPQVLLGSKSTLKSVRFLEFEVHRDISNSAWSRTTLKSVIESLSKKDFDCYFEGKDKLLRITGCWHEKYDQAGYVFFTNVVCAKRGDTWNNALITFEQK